MKYGLNTHDTVKRSQRQYPTPSPTGSVFSVYKFGYSYWNNILWTATEKQIDNLHIPMRHHMTFYSDPHFLCQWFPNCFTNKTYMMENFQIKTNLSFELLLKLKLEIPILSPSGWSSGSGT